MKICWRGGPFTARQIYDEAVKSRDWEYVTVKTMLDRLVSKGFLSREKLGPLCLYKTCVARSRVVNRAIDSFLDTVLDDALAPLFLHLAKGKTLSEEELAALRKLVEKHEEEDDGGGS